MIVLNQHFLYPCKCTDIVQLVSVEVCRGRMFTKGLICTFPLYYIHTTCSSAVFPVVAQPHDLTN